MNTPKSQRVGDNLLVASAYGDAFGLPFETRARAEIQALHPDGVQGLRETIDNPYFGSAPTGTWSDDTALSLAVAEALIQERGFSMEAMAERHIAAMEATPPIYSSRLERYVPRGWGDSTWQSLERIQQGEKTWQESGNPRATGNGVLIRLAPPALWQALTGMPDDEAHAHIQQLAVMTHASDLAVATALVHGSIMRRVFTEDLRPAEVPEAAAELALQYEHDYKGAQRTTSKLLGQLATLKEIDIPSILGLLETSDLRIQPASFGLHASEALVMTYGLFAHTANSPLAHIVSQAVSCGGDTDSVASMAAAMSVLHTGKLEQPDDVSRLHDLARLQQTGRALVGR